MECQRFQKLIKNWYLQVQSEAMAPARMVAFMERHLAECPVCLSDRPVAEEVKKIAAFVLKAAKAAKPDDSAEESVMVAGVEEGPEAEEAKDADDDEQDEEPDGNEEGEEEEGERLDGEDDEI